MKPQTLIPLALLLATLAAVIAVRFASPAPTAAADATGPDALALERIALTVARIEERQTATEKTLEELKMRATSGSAGGRTEVGGIDAAVARWMEEHGGADAEALEETVLGGANDLAATGSVSDIIAGLLGGALGDVATQELWQRLREEGRLDEVIAEFERLAELDPTNPDLQVDLGGAYLQKIFEVGAGPLAGVFGMKADEAFDRALEIDEHHWEARLTKAISLSNWPAFMGKSGEAIQHFEILIGQQQSGPANPAYAQSYYFLGNMYQQTGDAEKALEAWRRGLDRYPDNEMLLQQLANSGN